MRGETQITLVSFFFFQAEDGIRDLIVTGVQTCALPICHGAPLERGEQVHGAGNADLHVYPLHAGANARRPGDLTWDPNREGSPRRRNRSDSLRKRWRASWAASIVRCARSGPSAERPGSW